MAKTPSETLETFMCNCASKVQKMGKFTFALSLSKKNKLNKI